jgi:GNAT superfamily N-acetyltransferase
MLIVKSDQYRVRENWLHFRGLGVEPIQIPFGLGLRRAVNSEAAKGAGARTHRPPLKLQLSGRKTIAIKVKSHNRWRPVLPAFSRTVSGARRGAPKIVLQAAVTDGERAVARDIVNRAHYLKPRPGGVILLARIQSADFVRRARLDWWAQLTRKAKLRHGGSLKQALVGKDGIVGALHLERLMHGHPAGRTAIYKKDGLPAPSKRAMKRAGFRGAAVKELAVYWISRVAVDAPFRRLGVGSALCDAAREFASTRMIEPARNVELIRRLPIAEYSAISKGKSDFLTGRSSVFQTTLPFTLYVPCLSRKPQLVWNADRGLWERAPRSKDTARAGGDCLAYYYAKAGPMAIRPRRQRGLRKRRSA